MKEFWESKKVKAFVLGMIALILSDLLGLDDLTTKGIIGAIASYLVSQGAADIGKGKTQQDTKDRINGVGKSSDV